MAAFRSYTNDFHAGNRQLYLNNPAQVNTFHRGGTATRSLDLEAGASRRGRIPDSSVRTGRVRYGQGQVIAAGVSERGSQSGCARTERNRSKSGGASL